MCLFHIRLVEWQIVYPDQKLERSDLGLNCGDKPFCKRSGVQNFRTITFYLGKVIQIQGMGKHIQTAKAQISLHLHSLIRAFAVCCKNHWTL